MSVAYRAVQWNRHKKVYDLVVGAAIVLLVGGFVGLSVALAPVDGLPSPPILVIRALGATAGTLLTAILCIGPLARLDARFAPLLYNRRHVGVATCLVALAHAGLAIVWYHGFGTRDPLVSLLTSGTERVGAVPPYQPVGLLALLVLAVMAATSHDFWLKTLGPRAWKRLHMLVYPAWGLVVLHVAWGVGQTSVGPLVPALLALGVAGVGALHLAAGLRSRSADAAVFARCDDGWLDAGPAAAIADGTAVRVHGADGAPIAVFRDGDAFSAIAGTCAHQGGPLAEGRIVGGCITCPWHGYQYRAADGCSPPPYVEKLATHPIRIRDGRVEVHPEPLPPGTPVAPARLAGEEAP